MLTDAHHNTLRLLAVPANRVTALTPDARKAINAALAELVALRSAGDDLAKAARGVLPDIRDRTGLRSPLVAALAAWAAARSTRP